ncbi:hypothetical protein MSG_04335 [Mycobacterium shigaense]|uniref:Uncharacterized protein n=1 Tax=Mycobacterium shigaense TaxID=722731 RepID=A0A1Z4ENK0_9MYCO|nr:hypothetical protein MSG_04335 [Mycobacterium shigaense]
MRVAVLAKSTTLAPDSAAASGEIFANHSSPWPGQPHGIGILFFCKYVIQ